MKWKVLIEVMVYSGNLKKKTLFLISNKQLKNRNFYYIAFIDMKEIKVHGNKKSRNNCNDPTEPPPIMSYVILIEIMIILSLILKKL